MGSRDGRQEMVWLNIQNVPNEPDGFKKYGYESVSFVYHVDGASQFARGKEIKRNNQANPSNPLRQLKEKYVEREKMLV